MREILQDIGLSINESKVYLSLLESGLSGASAIAKQSKLHRANVYESLKRLSDKSLVSQVIINGSTKFEASSPQVLRTVIDEKSSRLNAIMPQLELQKNLSRQHSTQIIEGVTGFVSLLQELLLLKSDVFVLGSFPNSVLFSKLFHFETDCKKRGIRFVHEMQNAPPMIICKDTVIIHLFEKTITSIVIKNKSLADSYALFFSAMKNVKTAS
jgi:DNA-binding transcriptional regulator GbsR (MarR family)